MNQIRGKTGVLLALAIAAMALGAIVYAIQKPPTPRQLADRIQLEVEEIRGIQFKRPVPVKLVTPAEWREYVEGEMRKAPDIEHYWAAMRMLGVYRGPDLAPPKEVVAGMLGVPGGAYDARSGTFLLGTGIEGEQRKVVFAHELNHGMQDQHFDLQK